MTIVTSLVIRELKNKKEKTDPSGGEDIRNVNDDYPLSEAAHKKGREKKKKRKKATNS